MQRRGVLDMLNFVPINARLHLLLHCITMEVFTHVGTPWHFYDK